MTADQFGQLLEKLAAAWSQRNAVAAADCFAPDAVYMEPPDRQLFRGRDELIAYFSPLEEGTYLTFHHISFDAGTSTGAAEFSFGVTGSDSADHGVVIAHVRDGLIDSWREYHRKGPAAFADFVAWNDKQFDWHIGNYP